MSFPLSPPPPKSLDGSSIHTYLQSESTVFGNQGSAKTHVVTVDERASIALTVHDREVDSVTRSKWLSFQVARKTSIGTRDWERGGKRESESEREKGEKEG